MPFDGTLNNDNVWPLCLDGTDSATWGVLQFRRTVTEMAFLMQLKMERRMVAMEMVMGFPTGYRAMSHRFLLRRATGT